MKANSSHSQQPRARPLPVHVATSATSNGKSGHDSHDLSFDSRKPTNLRQRSPSEESDEIQIIEPPPKRVKVAEPAVATNPIPPLAGPSRDVQHTARIDDPGSVKVIKQESISAPLDTRTIMAIKEEQRSPSPLEPQPRAATSGTIRFHPLPPSCTHADTNYKRNRSYWARDQWNTVLKRNPGLQKRHAMIRDDGLAIDWTSPVPVWTDTLEPVTLDPREHSDDEEDAEDSQQEDDDVPILPPPSKPAKPPTPEIIDVDALPSDVDDNDGGENDEEEDESAYNYEEGGAYGIEDDVEYRDEAQGDSESDDQEDAITELEEECDVEGFREPPSSPINDLPTEEDAFASMLASTSRTQEEPTANHAADSLAKLRAQRRREMQQLTEGFISRYIQTFERDRELLAGAYASYAQFSVRTHARDASGAALVEQFSRSSPAKPGSVLTAMDIPRVIGRAEVMDAIRELGPHTYFPRGKKFDLDCDHVFLANVDGSGDVLLSFYGEVVLLNEKGIPTEDRLSIDQTMLLREVSGEQDDDESWPMVIVSHQMIVKDVPWRRDLDDW
ncbi:uncharacterized protein SCHCODRAFT_02617448 [Schizophyllum commune H4-8]|uniref:uncharacterized protein n=1 Tax=Schizophyllum commune (strain H4-8 / FGSC 9210) TaxID=578458 RepID=UPI00215F475B|nr:uncharacterized protein SCHCODRAFT_02617448 [Schizophyllum commune H4-8]KAI5894634.1 hypothetical protein SCHCODRAFT_02617448 [Schizophyllum commune H4-8]